MHALRAENAALKAELAALRADAGAFPSATHLSAPDDSAVSLPPNLRTWESAAGESLSGADLERYARHIALPAFGAEKQARLANARALIVGVGGLGSPAALYLAAAGVGRLDLADADVVERSNLHRQVIHADARCGASKALSAAVSIAALNPACHVTTRLENITNANVVDVVRDVDIVLDCTDNAQARYALSDACAALGKPLVSAAAVGTEGQLTVYVRDRVGKLVSDAVDDARGDASASGVSRSDRSNRGTPPGGRLPCYRCAFPTPPATGERGNCARNGVLGPVPGVMGVLQALEAVKVLTGLGERNGGRLLLFDAEANARAFSSFALRGADPLCVACGDRPSVTANAIKAFDYDAFVGDAPCASRTSTRASGEALPNALDDALAARMRNAAAARGDGAAPWAKDISPEPPEPPEPPKVSEPPELSPSVSGTATSFRLDVSSGPPLHARAEGPRRVEPSFLFAARRRLGDAVVVVDVRPKHLSDAARLRGALAIPLRELEARVGEVWRAVAGANAAATAKEARDAERRQRDARGGRRRGDESSTAMETERVLVSEHSSSARVYAICSKGNQSQLAESYLRSQGLPVAGDVLGGYEKWREDVDPSFPKL